jgi:hypothetical protein
MSFIKKMKAKLQKIEETFSRVMYYDRRAP